VTLSANGAQPLSMALHELATNAAKYGALSAPNGKVLLHWELDAAAGKLRLRWKERGGPAITGPPTRRGFGSRIIEGTLHGRCRRGMCWKWPWLSPAR
jgi:two-component sensor histidine kinase